MQNGLTYILAFSLLTKHHDHKTCYCNSNSFSVIMSLAARKGIAIELINQVSMFPELYDKSAELYKNNVRKTAIWDHIAKQIGFHGISFFLFNFMQKNLKRWIFGSKTLAFNT